MITVTNKILFFSTILLGYLSFFGTTAYSSPIIDIFVSIPPQKWISDAIGGNLVKTHVLVGKGQDPHTFEPRPKQIANLAQAKLYFTIEMPFEQQVQAILGKTLSHLQMVNVAAGVEKIPFEAAHEKHAHGTTETEERDPHIWLSPKNLKIIATNMARAMEQQNPENGRIFQENLIKLKANIDQLDTRIKSILAPYSGATFYVFHPSFGYFAHDYELHQEAVEASGKSPTPKQLARLIAQAREEQVQVIFVQPQFDPKSAMAIAQAINGKVVSLDPLAEDVATNLQTMAQAVADALKK